MNVATAVGRSLAAHGIDHVFGLVGSGNFQVTNALVAAGARFVPAAHEGGAASMADGYARVSGRLPALSVHQGPGVTNALTGITEAAKSRTPIVVLAPDGSTLYGILQDPLQEEGTPDGRRSQNLRIVEFDALMPQRLRCRRSLFDQSRVLLRHGVHLRDRHVDLFDAAALFFGSRCDLIDDLGHACDCLLHVRHRAARIVGE